MGKNIKTWSRWKYAEEDAKRLIDKGRVISITMEPDVHHEDDGEDYVYDEFTVTDLGPR